MAYLCLTRLLSNTGQVTGPSLGVDNLVLSEEHLPGGGASLQHVAEEVAPLLHLEVSPCTRIAHLLLVIKSFVFQPQ